MKYQVNDHSPSVYVFLYHPLYENKYDVDESKYEDKYEDKYADETVKYSNGSPVMDSNQKKFNKEEVQYKRLSKDNLFDCEQSIGQLNSYSTGKNIQRG